MSTPEPPATPEKTSAGLTTFPALQPLSLHLLFLVPLSLLCPLPSPLPHQGLPGNQARGTQRPPAGRELR